MHFTVFCDCPHVIDDAVSDLAIHIDKGTKDERVVLRHEFGFDGQGFLTGIRRDRLFFLLWNLSDYVENQLDGECTFEIG